MMFDTPFLPVLPVVSSCRFAQFVEIAAAIIPALRVVRIAKEFAFGAQDWICSFAVSSAPFSLVGIPLLQMSYSPFIRGGFLLFRVAGAPAAAGGPEFRTILACPSLLGRLFLLVQERYIT
ncbi:MAG TPA: hypothetical protein VKA02_04030 [Candidatus Acidoferrum sp.]|nr:hypothetical protein [Candidatus Acidoferrum sp.]